MFGIWRRKKTEILGWWYVIFDNFDTPVSEFYDVIENDLQVLELTGLEASRIEYSEGGLLSAKRQYLRFRRERLVFDVCAAPFGTTWLFSCRFAVIPFSLRWWEVIVTFLMVAMLVGFYAAIFGLILGTILLVASLLSLLLLMRNTVALGMQDVDAALLQIPILGALYECFVRTESYYRIDTRNAYKDIVEKVVKTRIEQLGASAKKHVEYRTAVPPAHPALVSMLGSLLQTGFDPTR